MFFSVVCLVESRDKHLKGEETNRDQWMCDISLLLLKVTCLVEINLMCVHVCMATPRAPTTLYSKI